VVSANFDRTGERVVTASQDKTARIWDARSGREVCEPLRHDGWVLSAGFSDDGTRVVTTSDDGTARVWNAQNGMPLTPPLRHKGWVVSASFSPDGASVITASTDKTAQVWDAATGAPKGEPLRHKGEVTNASFNRDGSKIMTSCADGTAQVWPAPADPAARQDASGELAPSFPTPLPQPRLAVQLCEAFSGLRFGDTGELSPLTTDERRQALAHLRKQESAGGLWDELRIRHFAPERTVSPGSRETMRNRAEQDRDRGTRDGLMSALRADCTLPLAHLLLASVIARQDAEQQPGQERQGDSNSARQAAFLRRFELDRLTVGAEALGKEAAAALWARAARILLETPDAAVGAGSKSTTCREEALRAARQAMALDPQLRAAQDIIQHSETETRREQDSPH
jgi:WD domain, G-beta repeat